MNLRVEISPELWEAIANPYEAGNYTHAVLEALHHLTTVLRERSGADGDGASLVGQALGGDAPRLRVNALQSESERNVQKGLEQLLRGLYLAVRNPRSHEQYKDTLKDADAIVHFVDYVLRILNSSTEAFTIERFLANLADPEFVESARYAELLVTEVLPNRRGDALAALFAKRQTVDLRKLRFLVPALRILLSEAQLAQFLSLVSEELRTATESAAIRTALQMISPDLWPHVSEAGRLRVETKLIREINDGEILFDGTVIGALGTWANSFMKNFSLRTEGARALLSKLENSKQGDRHYVAKYFLPHLPDILMEEHEVKQAVRAIAGAIRGGDANIREALIAHVRQFPAGWQTELVASLKDVTDAANPAVLLGAGVPFLSAPTATDFSDDDIPF